MFAPTKTPPKRGWVKLNCKFFFVFFTMRFDIRINKVLFAAWSHLGMEAFPNLIIHQGYGGVKIDFLVLQCDVHLVYSVALLMVSIILTYNIESIGDVNYFSVA